MLRKTRRAGSVVAIAMGMMASFAAADVTISIDHVSVPPGGTAVVGIYASSNSGDVLSGFNLPFDINDDGFVDADTNGQSDLPSGFALATPILQNLLYANTGWDVPQPQITLINVDAIPTGSGANVSLSAVPTRLFNLVVNVSASVLPGTVVPLSIIVPQSPFTPLFNVAGPSSPVVSVPTQGNPARGSITVIPEPASSLTGCFLTLVCLNSRCFRRGD